MNNVLQKEFDNLVNIFKFRNELRNRSFFITGATGFIGLSIVKFLSKVNDVYDLGLSIYAQARDRNKVNVVSAELNNIIWCIQDDFVPKNNKIDFIIHTACPTQSSYLFEHSVEVINGIIPKTIELFNYIKDNNIKSTCFLSSLEIYGQNFDDNKITESDYKYIDVLEVRSCYPECKKLIECLCMSYNYEYKTNINIARLTQVYGPGISLQDKRVFAYFANCVINNKDIVLKTRGGGKKPYIYISDAINAIFYVLLLGEKTAYNVADENSYISISDFAQFVIQNFSKNINVRYNIDNDHAKIFAKESKLNLSTQLLQELGWKPVVDFKYGYQKLIEYLKELKCSAGSNSL